MKALITGASSGIGKEISKYLASFGYDLYVVSRNKEKLDKIYKNFKVKVTTIGLDLSDYNNCIKLHDMLKDKNIDLLVNNAGFGDAGFFNNTSLDKEIDMIKLNVVSYHVLTKLFLKDFIKKNHGRILNVASMAGFMPGPNLATYYATKAYVLNLSLAIYEELRQLNSNVKIFVFCPGPVDTNFDNVANSKFRVSYISSEYASRYAIDNMFKNKLIIIPSNMKLNHLLIRLVPTKLILKVNSLIQGKNKDEIEK